MTPVRWLTSILLPAVVPFVFGALNYSCDTEGVLTVQNPDAAKWVTATASNGDENCTTAFNDGYSTLTITSCNTSRRIDLMFSDSETTVDHKGLVKKGVFLYSILCRNIPVGGLNRTVLDESWVTNLFQSTAQPSVTPEVEVTTELLDMENRTKKEEAFISEPIRWEIVGPEGYRVIPMSCTAYSGTSVNNDPYRYVDIIEYGCTRDEEYVSDFYIEDPTKPHIVVATVYAFRFPDSNDVTLQCTMLGCPLESFSCDIWCGPSFGRRRRAIADAGGYALPQPVVHVYRRSNSHGRRQNDINAHCRVYGEPNMFGTPVFPKYPANSTGHPVISSIMKVIFCVMATACVWQRLF